MAEQFLMIFEDGPYPGQYKAPSMLSWPLPDNVIAYEHDKGVYKKTFESKGPAIVTEETTQLRGAKYVWDENLVPEEVPRF